MADGEDRPAEGAPHNSDRAIQTGVMVCLAFG